MKYSINLCVLRQDGGITKLQDRMVKQRGSLMKSIKLMKKQEEKSIAQINNSIAELRKMYERARSHFIFNIFLSFCNRINQISVSATGRLQRSNMFIIISLHKFAKL